MWDPDSYLDFADERGRPFFDLVSRIRADHPRRVIDLGCGPGNLTVALARRWPDAALEAVDSSPEMVAEARSRHLPAHVADVREWQPPADADVVVTNAVLQWVPDHPTLLRQWIAALPSGAWFAMQVPGNFDAPSHRAIRELAAEPHWHQRLDGLTKRYSDVPVLDPIEYAEILGATGAHVDAWETTYAQLLYGPDPVLEWVTGTALRPVRAALNDQDWTQFRSELARRLTAAYPPRPDGSTWFPFRRVFAVAQTS